MFIIQLSFMRRKIFSFHWVFWLYCFFFIRTIFFCRNHNSLWGNETNEKKNCFILFQQCFNSFRLTNSQDSRHPKKSNFHIHLYNKQKSWENSYFIWLTGMYVVSFIFIFARLHDHWLIYFFFVIFLWWIYSFYGFYRIRDTYYFDNEKHFSPML